MKKNIFLSFAFLSVLAMGIVYLKNTATKKLVNYYVEESDEKNEAGIKRLQYEYDLLKNPTTGKIPKGIRQQELDATKDIPSRNDALGRNTNQNTYIACGPNSEGGRTRTIAPDIRYNGTTNQVIIAGGVNGGIYRTTNGGTSWTWVHPENEIHALTALAQDPRPGFQDTWYAAGGEFNGASANIYTAFISSMGIFKSTDNGLTWTRTDPVVRNNDAAQTNLNSGTYEAFDHPMDLVHHIAVHPTTGHVYVGGHRRIMRSTNGGANFDVVLGGATGATNDQGQVDIAIAPDGSKIYAAFCGVNPDNNLVGIWESTTGNVDIQGSNTNWTRIAGAAVGSPTGWDGPSNWATIAIAIAPSSPNIIYAMYEKSDGVGAKLFMGNRTTNTWSDRSAGLFANQNATNTPFATQGGYDFNLAVKPDDPNTVFAVGTNLYRSIDGFTTMANSTFMGGYNSTSFTGFSHPDFHAVAFNPSNPNEMFVANDGGVQKTINCTTPITAWTDLNNNYQTHQYYHTAIDPTANALTFAGGTQDNATTFRDGSGLLSFLGATNGVDDHWKLIGGDGAAVGITSKDPNNANRQFLFGASQEGNIYRFKLFNEAGNIFSNIKPTGVGTGLFVTYFHLDNDNTNNLYYVNGSALYRSTSATTVTSGSWTSMTGTQSIVNSNITSMATTRGTYNSNNNLFIGTSTGNIFRLTDPANTSFSSIPTNILAPSSGIITAGSVVLDIAVNPRSQDSVMAVVSNYGVNSIFFTGNATSPTPTWTVCEGNLALPSIQSCEIVVKTTGVEFYVGTSVGLFSTLSMNAAATAWVREGTGMLKFAVVRSLAYRWNDNTMVVATHGNGMFYTQIGNAVVITTGVNDIVRNDKNFIRKIYPTITNSIIQYETGNMLGIQKIDIRITDMSGKLVLRKEESYTTGILDIGKLASGGYVVTISNANKKQQFVQRVIKE
jgi:Secretion system C-terminal sorting domain